MFFAKERVDILSACCAVKALDQNGAARGAPKGLEARASFEGKM